MALANLLTRTCTIERPAFTTSAMGEQEVTFSTIATGVRCEIQERTVELNRKDVGEFIEGRVRFYFLPGTDIKERDRVTDDEGIIYEVRFVDDYRSLIRGGIRNHIQVTMIRPDLTDFSN